MLEPFPEPSESERPACVHPSAAVDPEARLGPGVEVGPFAVIGPKVVIGAGARIRAHAVVDGCTTLGREVDVFPFACVGGDAQHRGGGGADPAARRVDVGARTVIREYVTVNAGTVNPTRVGCDAMVMAYSHVAHDCVLGNGVVLANHTTLAGHVEIGEHAVFGGLVAIQQHVRVGRAAFVSGGAMVERDVPPFCRVAGDRARLVGLNVVGLERLGAEASTVRALKLAYRTLFRSDVPIAESVAALRASTTTSEVVALCAFIAESQKGICR